nr:ribonuclease H-like domain-containing protein [Tanacetum cinerariifolium]
MAGEDTSQPPPPPIASTEAPHMVSSVKLPILKKVKVPPVTAQQILARKRERKAKSTLLMAIPNEHLARFYGTKDAKTLWDAIKTRFGEGLDKGYDRFQRLLSLHEIHRAGVSTKDANQNFLRSLPLAWSNISLIMRNKLGIDNLDIDYLYNNLKVYKADIKGSSGSSSNSQNAQGSSSYADELMFLFFANQYNSPQLDNEDLKQINQDDLEEIDLKWQGAGYRGRDNGKRHAREEDEKALVVQDGLGTYDWSYQVEEKATDFAFMAFTSNPSSSSSTNSEREKLRKANLDIVGYQYGLESIEGQLRVHQQNEVIYEENIGVLEYDVKDKSYNSQFNEKEVLDLKEEEVTETVFDNRSSDEENSLANDRFKKVFTRSGRIRVSAAKPKAATSTSAVKPVNTAGPKKSVNFSKSISTFHKSHSPIRRSFYNATTHLRRNSSERVNIVRSKAVSAVKGNGVTKVKTSASYVWRPRINEIDQIFKENRWICTRVDYVDPQGRLKHMKRNKAYLADCQEINDGGFVTFGSSRASIDESNLWHRRLGHVNFKTMNKLVKGNLVRGIPSKIFENNHTCVACQMGKQHKATYETSKVLKPFITAIENQINKKVKVIRCDNGTEIKNRDLVEFCGMKWIKREYNNARTPQQNQVAEKKNKTLIEAARTMLADSLLPITFWAEAVNIVCYVLNRALVTKLMSQEKEASDAADTLTKEFEQGCIDQRGATKAGSTNSFNTISNPVNAASTLGTFSACGPSSPHLDAFIPANTLLHFKVWVQRLTSTTWNLPLLLVIFPHRMEPKKVAQALDDESWVEAMQEKLLHFRLQKVWRLVDLPYRKKVIRTKWVYRNKKDKRGIVVRNKARLVAQRHRQEERIDYDEVFAHVARNEAIRVFLAFASFMRFIVYQMDVKSTFLYGTIKEELYVSQPLVFIDPQFLNKSEEEIFISQDKYVAEILKKFDFSSVKIASTPIKTQKPLVKDEEATDVDVHLYRSMIISLMYLIASRRDIMFAVYACSRRLSILGMRLISWQYKKQTIVATFTTEADISCGEAVDMIWRCLRDGMMFDLGKGESLVRAATTASLDAQRDSSNITKTESMATLNEPTPQGEGSGYTVGSREDRMEHDIELTDHVLQTPRDSPLSGGHTPRSDKGSMTLKELTDFCTTLLQKVLDLENVKTAQEKEIASLKKREESIQMGRKNLKSQQMFQDIDDVLDEDADTEMIVEDKGNGEKGGSIAETVSTTRPDISAARLEVSTTKPKTPPTIATLFDDEDVTISDTLAEDEKRIRSIKKRVAGSSSKRKSPKKQKVNDQESEDSDKEHRKCLKVISDDDKEINYETLDVKSPIVDYESQVLGTNEAEKRYPLTKEIVEKMLSLRLEAETKSTLALDLIKFIKLQIEENDFARFKTIITSLKALDEVFSSKNYVRKFLRALHPKLRAKVTTIEELKALPSLALDELIENLKSLVMITLNANKESSDDETLTSGSDDEEYVMAVRNFKKFFRRKGKFVRQPREE